MWGDSKPWLGGERCRCFRCAVARTTPAPRDACVKIIEGGVTAQWPRALIAGLAVALPSPPRYSAEPGGRFAQLNRRAQVAVLSSVLSSVLLSMDDRVAHRRCWQGDAIIHMAVVIHLG